MIILQAIAALVVAPFLVLGLYAAYCIHRYSRSGYVDSSAAAWSYVNVMWLVASQPAALAKKLGFPGQDLSEALNVREDDGEIT